MEQVKGKAILNESLGHPYEHLEKELTTQLSKPLKKSFPTEDTPSSISSPCETIESGTQSWSSQFLSFSFSQRIVQHTPIWGTARACSIEGRISLIYSSHSVLHLPRFTLFSFHSDKFLRSMYSIYVECLPSSAPPTPEPNLPNHMCNLSVVLITNP